ncbi:hypothetical protein [Roseomonas sp. 18066]|uniref:hypothetical protein n=1 Tax=Roseomonas sp. 18066 TaxID=2681412 RepID=UPI001358D5E0|nr:hypothetical protein [Roseomonas sp. 18066]
MIFLTAPQAGPSPAACRRRRLGRRGRWLAPLLAALAMALLALASGKLLRFLLAGSGHDIGTAMLAGLPAAVAVLALVGIGPGRSPRRHGAALLAAVLLAVLACGPMMLFITTIGALLAFDEARDGWATLQEDPVTAPVSAFLAASVGGLLGDLVSLVLYLGVSGFGLGFFGFNGWAALRGLRLLLRGRPSPAPAAP